MQWLSFPKHPSCDEFPYILQAVWMSARYCVALNKYITPPQSDPEHRPYALWIHT